MTYKEKAEICKHLGKGFGHGAYVCNRLTCIVGIEFCKAQCQQKESKSTN